jgi:hypothetical protein
VLVTAAIRSASGSQRELARIQKRSQTLLAIDPGANQLVKKAVPELRPVEK